MSTNKAEFLLLCEDREMLGTVLDVSAKTLRYLAYGAGQKYKTFSIPKKGGGKRIITAPVEVLKSVQKKLASVLTEIYHPLPCVVGFVKDKSVLTNAQPHVGSRIVLNIDLKDFFPSITTSRVIGLFKAKPFSFGNEIVSTIAGLVCYQGSLPQGAPTSPIISNMIALRMDKELFAMCKRERVSYTRYADDITFSTMRRKLPRSLVKNVGDDGLVELGDELLRIIKSNYFEINETKTRIHFGTKSKFVTGVKVNSKPNLSRRFTRRVRAMIHAWERFGLEQAQEANRSLYAGKRDFAKVVRGKLAHMKSIKGVSDEQYSRLYNKFVAVEGKGRDRLPVGENERLCKKVFVVKSGGAQGTGFVVDNRLWTCHHTLVDPNFEYFDYVGFASPVDRKQGRRDECVLSREFDLATIEIEPTAVPATQQLEFCSNDEQVIIEGSYKSIGFPLHQLGGKPHITTNIVVGSFRSDKYGVMCARVNTTLVAGSSGSPVLNDKNQVVGMVFRGAPSFAGADPDYGYYFIPIQEMRRFMFENKIS